MLDQQAIKQAVLSGEMTWSGAMELLTAKRGMPWHTAEWKKRRDALVGSVCMQCGSTELPMVLQHTWHPAKLSILFGQAQQEFEQEYLKKHPYPDIQEMNVGERPACPRCKTTAIKQQKSGKWCCNPAPMSKVRHGYFLFDEPVMVLALTPQQKRDLVEKRRAAGRKWHEKFMAKHRDDIGKRAVTLSIEHNERYMALEDVTTFCKKCAFLWDVKSMKLCGECRQHYHGFGYQRCYECNQQLGQVAQA